MASIKHLFLSILLLPSLVGHGQISFSPLTEIKVFENGMELKLPFSGGLNSGQYNTMDLDLDGDEDLVIFDRSSDKIITFLNNGSDYEYSPEYEYLFPRDIQNWMILADYNCDGNKDIFTNTNLGIRVFENTSVSQLSWQLVQDPIFTQGTSSQINLAVNSTDIPSIADLDEDGDLDILVFNFATGGFIEFHKNMSMENNGNCLAVEYVRESRQYGDFQECFCDEFAFDGEPCLSGGRVLHAGGRSILAIDNNGDGDMELVIGQEECVEVNILENKGSSSTPVFDSFSNLFPENGGPLNITSFPVPYYEDVTFDGIKDIIMAPNLRSNANAAVDNTQSSWLYANTGTESNPNFSFETNQFLQEEMIDVGEYSYPSFVDIDGDLDDDLIVGNRGSMIQGTFVATLKLYLKTPDGFVLSDEDYATLSSLNLNYINPSFQDLDDDGRLDLILTAQNENDDAGLFYILNSSTSTQANYQPSGLTKINSDISNFDDAELFDVNEDGTLDLLLAKSNGILEYYVNVGSNLLPNFTLEDGTFLGLDFSGSNSNLNIDIYDIDGDQKMDILTTDRSGELKAYLDFSSGSSLPDSELVSLTGSIENIPTVLGRITSPAIGQVDGKTVIASGNIRGGLTLLSSTSTTIGNGENLDLTVFPSPSKIDKHVKFFTPNELIELELFNISGGRIVGPVELPANEVLNINLSGYRNGLYLARIKQGKQFKTVKFILGNETTQ